MWWGVVPHRGTPGVGQGGGRELCSRTAAPGTKAKPKLKFPHFHGHQSILAMEMSVVLVQHCSLGTGLTGAHVSFGKSFHSFPQQGAGESRVSVATDGRTGED